MDVAGLFDVEPFRELAHRHAVLRHVDRPTLVLGSTQPAELVAPDKLVQHGCDLRRRRGGGGAVFLQPDEFVWVDAWVPRDDPLWRSDVGAAAAWVGEWWCHSLGVADREDWSVHREGARPGPLGELVCFAGRGPGEVFVGQRKVVGLSQWRSREGALFLSCAYTQWRPQPLADLLDVAPEVEADLVRDLAPLAVGLSELVPAAPGAADVGAALLASFPTWGNGGFQLA